MKAILTIGLPASGKSTWAKQFCLENGYVQIERDEIRKQVYPDFPNYKPKRTKEDLVSEIAYNLMKDCAKSNTGIVVSDTNLNTNFRVNLVYRLKELGYDVEYEYFTDIPYKEINRRNLARANSVPQFVIDNMAKNNPDMFPWIYEEFSLVKDSWSPDETLPKAVLVDLDGTIADMRANGRSPYDMTRVAEDDPHEDVIDLIRTYAQSKGYKIVIVSARSDINGGEVNSKKWLDQYFPEYDAIFMRHGDDWRKDNIVKEEIFRNQVLKSFNPVCVFDDRMQVVKLWSNLGLRVYQVYTPYQDSNEF